MKGAQKAKSKGSMSPKGGAKKKTRQCMVEIEIDPSDTIETVKAKICQTGGNPPSLPRGRLLSFAHPIFCLLPPGLTFDQEQRLIFDGMEVLRCYTPRVLCADPCLPRRVLFVLLRLAQVMDHKRVRQYSIAPGDVVHLIRKER